MATSMSKVIAEGSGSAQQQAEDDVSLPRAAVNKMIKEMIPSIRVSNDARELILTCCKEFIHLISSEANEICNKQMKKTISPDHIIAALGSLGFTQYLEEIKGVHAQFKSQASNKKKSNRLENLGIPEEELLRQQEAMFAQARVEQAQEEWMQMQQNMQQQQQVAMPQMLEQSEIKPQGNENIDTNTQSIANKSETIQHEPMQPSSSIITSVIQEPRSKNNQEQSNQHIASTS